VQAGHRALLFAHATGLRDVVLGEGWHLCSPRDEYPVLYDVRPQRRHVVLQVASRDLRVARLTLAVDVHPVEAALPALHRALGPAYAERMVAPLATEVLRAAAAERDAAALQPRDAALAGHVLRELNRHARQFHVAFAGVVVERVELGPPAAEAEPASA
jgi:hypothetical protein